MLCVCVMRFIALALLSCASMAAMQPALPALRLAASTRALVRGMAVRMIDEFPMPEDEAIATEEVERPPLSAMQKLRLQTEGNGGPDAGEPKITSDQLLPSGDSVNAIVVAGSLAVFLPVLYTLANEIIKVQSTAGGN